MKPDTFVGIDLTDRYAARPRGVDVAILDADTGDVRFDTFDWPAGGDDDWKAAMAQIINGFRRDRTVFIVDGPQALARPKNNTRDVERCLGTPGHTPWQCPVPGSRPFAGYIRTSLDFFNALVHEGFHLADLDGANGDADLYEAYPGAVWPRWHEVQEPLRSKSTPEGRAQRRTILENVGCHFDEIEPTTHDQLDAAVCAALGWRFLRPADDWTVEMVRNEAVTRDADGTLREGRMLIPVRRARGWPLRNEGPDELPTRPVASIPRPSRSPTLPPTAATVMPPEGRGQHQQLPRCDWVYFATPMRANQTETYDLAAQEEVISRTVLDRRGRRINKVVELQPQETILLAYGESNRYTALCRCTIDAPPVPVRHKRQVFHAIARADPVLAQRLQAAGYSPDPTLGPKPVYPVIPIREIQDLQGVGGTFGRPKGNDAIWSWDEASRLW